jgi:hypothetical protein
MDIADSSVIYVRRNHGEWLTCYILITAILIPYEQAEEVAARPCLSYAEAGGDLVNWRRYAE